MATKVIMPQLGESVVEGVISRWLAQEGDAVEKDQAILEVSTDKVDTEVPAPASGALLKRYFPEGATVPAGQVIALIGQPGEAVADQPERIDLRAHEVKSKAESPTFSPAEAAPLPDAQQPAPKSAPGRISPVVARMAQEHAIDLSQISGTGREGRITKKDMLAYLETRKTGQTAAFAPPATAKPAPASLAEELVPISRLRRLIAEHMTASKRTSPHVTTVMEVDMTAVVAHRLAHKDELAAKGVNLTFTPYFIQAVLAGLKATPAANAVWREEGLLLKRRYHIGMATAIEDGLIVPVIHDADELSLSGLARKVNDLAARARSGQLQPDEIQGSTFTITNHGVGGSLFATPIINQPNAGILGVGAIQKRPVVISRGHPIEPSADDFIAIRPMVYLSFTFDHRVLDGAGADGFLMVVKRALEEWR